MSESGSATEIDFGRPAGAAVANRIDISELRAVPGDGSRPPGDRNWLRSAPGIGFGRRRGLGSVGVGAPGSLGAAALPHPRLKPARDAGFHLLLVRAVECYPGGLPAPGMI